MNYINIARNMSRKLDNRIQDQIDLIVPPAKKELTFIKKADKNWSEVSNIDKRETMYKLQDLLNSRNIGALLKFHEIAKDELSHPDVKKTINLLLEFYFILEERYNNMEQKFDWTTYVDDYNVEGGEGLKAEKKQEREITFQNGVLKDYSSFKEKLRRINFGEESLSIDIPVHGDIPIPIVMHEVMENRYPEIKEFIDKKRDV